ncbi:DUF2164 domain-containing protein [Devosia sp.]|uniref:DUF2164 domain-containing protein n=1 Tax=Devosia sp. TaxID=1871048 RepID=UPI003A94DA54
MHKIRFEKEQRTAIVSLVQRYFVEELDSSIGAIPAELLVEFFAEHIGPHYYNQGLADAQAVFAKSLDDVNDAIYGLEQRDAR